MLLWYQGEKFSLTHSLGPIVRQADCVEASSARTRTKLELSVPASGWYKHWGKQSVWHFDWDSQTDCFFPSREVRSTFQWQNNTLLLSRFLCRALFCYFCCYFSSLVPRVQPLPPYRAQREAALQSVFFCGKNWNLCFIHKWLVPYVTAEHQIGPICWSLLIRWSAGLSSRATIRLTFVVLSEIWTVGWIVIKNLVQTFMLPSGVIVIILLLP